MDNRQHRTALRLAAVVAAVIALVLAAVLVWRLVASGRDSTEIVQADADSLASDLDRFNNRDRSTPPKFDLGGAAKAAVSGTIHDPAGKPIVGAQVCAFANKSELRGFGDPRHKCVRSGPDGYYRLEGLWPVKTGIHVSAPTFKPKQWERRDADGRHETELPLRAGQTIEGIDVELEPGGVLIRGVIKDIAGGRIEGAQVMVMPAWGSSSRAAAVEFSGAKGQFETWVAPGEVMVRASVNGYAPGEVKAIAPGEFVELFLTPESVLVGKVVLASNGDPVEGAVVSVGSRWFMRGSNGSEPATRSDADGRFRIDELQPGTYKPSAEGDDFYGQLAEQVHLGLGETSDELVIRVHPAAYIEGRVVIAGSERPCPGAQVSLQNVAKRREYAIADDEGQVEFRGVLAGDYEVTVWCDGYVPLADYPDIAVAEDNIGGLVWEVNEGLAIRGLVVDQAGEPVPDIHVRARAVLDPKAARGQGTRSGNPSEDDGSFELRGLLPGRYEVSVASWRSRPGPLEPVTVELDGGADINDLRIVMPAVGRIRGRVVDESGAPVSGARLEAELVGSRSRGSSRTNDAGEFEIADLRPGETRVTASGGGGFGRGATLRKPGTTDDDLQGEVVKVVANEVVEVVLTVESRGGTITGVVNDQGGGPVADAFINIERESDRTGASESAARRSIHWGWGDQPVLTDQDGHFELGGLPDGTFVIRANRKGGGGEAIVENVAIGDHVALVIASTGELAGTVTVAGGGAPERFTVNITDKAGGIRLSDSFFRTGGVWRLSEVPAGHYEIVATAAEGNVTLEPELDLGEGEVREGIELVLTPRLTVRGRIVDLETREPVAGLTVQISGSNRIGFGRGDGENLNVSGPDGSFEVENVPVGAVILLAVNRAGGSEAKYQVLFQRMTLAADPLVQDIGEIEIIARRLEPNEKPGDLGYTLNGWDPTREPEDYEPIVALVRPGGPAEGSGLVAGDVIEKVQGHDVLGTNSSHYRQLTRLPAGSKLKLEIRGGKSVEIILGPPIR